MYVLCAVAQRWNERRRCFTVSCDPNLSPGGVGSLSGNSHNHITTVEWKPILDTPWTV